VSDPAASAAIVGRVLRHGSPEAGARVAITGASPAHRDIALVTGADGAYGFGSLVPGRYTIAAYADDGRGEASVTVVAGEEATLDIRLEGGR
jgi:hypothetical protein